MHRKAYIDWARGIAVLLMIWAHTTDAWTRLNVRSTIAFRDATVLGGFAAPLFLWLAGVAVVLAATKSAERSGSRTAAVEAICRRGLEIFILGFLFRLQGFIVTPGSHPVTLFRVDILNIMGPAIVVAGIVWGVARGTAPRVFWYSAIAGAMAMLTPIIRASSAVDTLPLSYQWYIRPFGEFTIFTVFPWAAFVFAGGAVGALVAAARDERTERLLQVVLAVTGTALVVVGFYTAGRPSIYASSSFWTTSPTWFAIRLGILMIALAVIYGCEVVYAALKGARARSVRVPAGPGEVRLQPDPTHSDPMHPDPLARLGQNSLFIYFIHVELVYGYASWGWRHRLPLWGTVIGFVLFSLLMYRAIGWRDTFVAKWRGRSAGRQAQPRVATA